MLSFSWLGCYEKEVTYINGATNEPIPLSQIDSLKQLSSHCLQTFYYECTLAPLRDDSIDFAYWTDRHGEKNLYFTGMLCSGLVLPPQPQQVRMPLSQNLSRVRHIKSHIGSDPPLTNVLM